MITMRRFQSTDAAQVAQLVTTTLKQSNRQDYSANYLQTEIDRMSPAFFIEKAQQTHFYVACDQTKLVGTGAIGSYWGSTTEYSLFTIFVLPTYQGRGIGRQIINTLEQDTYFKKAQRVEIPASITAVNFYQHLGYHFKNQNQQVDDEQLYRLEKFPQN